MRIVRVRAKAFGPFRGAVLELAPGLNVVHGPNEAGKSTWHAAIFAGLCGVRRVRGGIRAEDRAFAERHRPWSGDEWAVSIEVELGSGLRLELVQNLEDQVGCRAIDLATGRDVSSELGLLHEGTPDGARLFGLTRRTLPYSMFVRQADILGILGKDRPHELHEELERAAATAGADETAERAIRTLREFRRESVGPDKPGGPRPLGLALAVLAEAERQAGEARRKHGECLALAAQCEAAEATAARAEAEAQAAWRAVAQREQWRAAQQLGEARGLAARFPEGAPADPAAGRDVRDRVLAALAAFEARPLAPAPLDGPSAAEIEARVALGEEAGPSPTPRAGRILAPLVPAAAGLALLAFGRPLFGMGLLGAALALLALVFYRAVARTRAGQGPEAAARRDELTRRLADRRAAEQAAARDLARRGETQAELQRAAQAAGVEPCKIDEIDEIDAIDGLAERLRAFVRRTDLEATSRQADREAWARLEQLLEGRSLAELEEDLQSRTSALGELPLAAAPRGEGAAPAALALSARAARTELDALRGRLAEREHEAPDVARAEEQLAQARSAVLRLRELDLVLDQTLSFLTRARDEVQRDFAPLLAAAIRSRLARITGGRYVDATVDPATLDVRVRNPAGELVRAGLLSHGTTEQVYLLLRVALAERLVVGPERAPLILDDVTSQADPQRTTALLDLLHELSRDRQIVLFSQESAVRAWAAARLTGPADRLVDLPPPEAAADRSVLQSTLRLGEPVP